MTCLYHCALLIALLTGDVVVFAADDAGDADYAARFFCPPCRTTTFHDEPALNDHLWLEHGNSHAGMYLDYMPEAALSARQADPGQHEHEPAELPGPATTPIAWSTRGRRRARYPPSRIASNRFNIREHHDYRTSVPCRDPGHPGTSTPTRMQPNDGRPRCHYCSVLLSNSRHEVDVQLCCGCHKEPRQLAFGRPMTATDGASGQASGAPPYDDIDETGQCFISFGGP